MVTGAAGFIGSTLVRRLLDDGQDVIGIDSITDYYDPKLKLRNLDLLESPSFVFHRADIADPAVDLGVLLAGASTIFHLAGQPGVRSSWGHQFGAYIHANVSATQRLLEVAAELPTLDRLVYASSSSIYGNAESYPTREDDLPAPISPYGVTKLAGEHLCSLYGNQYGVPTTALRYFTVYGPRQRPDMAFTRFIRAYLRGEKVSVYGDGRQIRDFTYVDDIVEANILAASVASAPGSVFNVAGGSEVTVNEVLELLGSFGGHPVGVDRRAAGAGDVRQTGGSTDLITDELGWAAAVQLEEGLRRQYDWGLEYFAQG